MLYKSLALNPWQALRFAIAYILIVSYPTGAGTSEGYRHDSTAVDDNSKWMANIPGSIQISEMSLPGTHDSGAYNFGGDTTITQTLQLSEQLKAGIRVLDMRLGSNHLNIAVECLAPDLWTFHGIACQFQRFKADILTIIQTFLRDNPSEAVLMRVRNENNGGISNFTASVEAEMDSFPGLFWNGTERNPSLGSIRGRILLLRNYGDANNPRGIPFPSGFEVQDMFMIGDLLGLADKWSAVKTKFIATDNIDAKQTKHVNFLSATGGSFPYFYASGKSSPGSGDNSLLTGCTEGVINSCPVFCRNLCIPEYYRFSCFLGTCSVGYKGVNDIAFEFIRDSVKYRTGIVFADFPGPGLIRAIIDLNSKLVAPPTLSPLQPTLSPVLVTPPTLSPLQPTLSPVLVAPPTLSPLQPTLSPVVVAPPTLSPLQPTLSPVLVAPPTLSPLLVTPPTLSPVLVAPPTLSPLQPTLCKNPPSLVPVVSPTMPPKTSHDDDDGEGGMMDKGGKGYDDDDSDSGKGGMMVKGGKGYDDDDSDSGKGGMMDTSGKGYDDDDSDSGKGGMMDKGGKGYDDDDSDSGKGRMMVKGGKGYDDDDSDSGKGGMMVKGGKGYDGDGDGKGGMMGKGGKGYDYNDGSDEKGMMDKSRKGYDGGDGKRRMMGKGGKGHDDDDDDDSDSDSGKGGMTGKSSKGHMSKSKVKSL